MTMAQRVKKAEYMEIPGLDHRLTVIENCPDGQKILYRKPYSNLFGDGFLEYVVAFWHDRFVVWFWNHQSGGFGAGQFFELSAYPDSPFPLLDSLIEALKWFDKRGVRTEIGEHLALYARESGVDRKAAQDG